MTTRTLTITLLRPDSTPVEGATVSAVLVDSRGRKTTDQAVIGTITTLSVSAETNSSGVAELELSPNVLGSQDTLYMVSASDPDTGAALLRRPGLDAQLIVMPDADTTLQQVSQNQDPDDDALIAAAVSAYYAELWATHDPAQPVPAPPGDGDLLSSRGYAVLAGGFAQDAAGARDTILQDAGFIAVATDLLGANTIGTVAGISAEVAAVSGITSEVVTVSANVSNIGTVAGIGSEVTAVAQISESVSEVSSISEDVSSVASIKDEIIATAESMIYPSGGDDTEQINDALNAVPEGGGVVVLNAGDYIISGPLLVKSNTRLIGRGPATRIRLADGSDSMMITNSEWGDDAETFGNENIVIQDMLLDGNRQNNTAQSVPSPIQGCIDLINVDGAKISGVYAKSSVIHGINLSSRDEYASDPEDKGPGCRDVIIESCVCWDFGDDGITTHDSKRITISSSICFDAGASWTGNSNGIEIDDGSNDVVINDCIVYNCNDGVECKGHDVRQGHVATTMPPSNVSISGVQVFDCETGFDIGHVGTETKGRNIKLSNCSAIECVRFARVISYDDVAFSGCHGSRSASSTVSGLAISQATNDDPDSDIACVGVVINACTFEGYQGASRAVVTVGTQSRDVVISGNVFTTESRGVWVGRNTERTIIEHNTITVVAPGTSGIIVDSESASNFARDVAVSSNIFNGPGISGFAFRVVQGQISNVSFTGNVVQGFPSSGRASVEVGGINNTVADCVIITGNIIDNPGSRAGIGLRADDSGSAITNVVVSGNVLRNHHRYGAIVAGISDAIISGNLFVANGQESDDTYEQLRVTGNSTRNNIQGNTFRKGDKDNKPSHGIRVISGSNDNVITNNDLLDAGETGAIADAGTGTVTAAGNRE